MIDQKKVDRYSPEGFEGELCKSEYGDWVRYDDYAEVVAEVKALRTEIELRKMLTKEAYDELHVRSLLV